MKVLAADQLNELWDEYWNSMTRQWFKLEVLQDYTSEDDGPSLQAWLAGDRQKSLELLETDDDPEFTADCRQKIAQGVDLCRLHIIKEPLSAYMQWELAYYKKISVPLRGEKVAIINRKEIAGINLPKGDLMIFDDSRAIVNTYDQKGRVVSAEFYDHGDDLSQFLELRKALLNRAKPL